MTRVARRYTVLGASGFVGSRLAATLRAGGHEVLTPPRDADLSGLDLGVAFYCIGRTSNYQESALATVEAHVTVLAETLSRAEYERIIYLSSTRLYDEAKTGEETRPLPLSPRSPRHVYDLSKALGESLCLNAAGGRGAVARLSGVFDTVGGAGGFLSSWLAQARRAKAVRLDSAPATARDYIHVSDVVAGLIALADGDFDIVNVASGRNVSNAEIAAALNRHGWSVGFTSDAPQPPPPVCDVGRLRSLGVDPTPVLTWIERFAGENS